MENTTERRWIDVKAAALYLGTSVTFVRSLLWDGEVCYIRCGKRFIIDRDELDACMVRRKERNPA